MNRSDSQRLRAIYRRARRRLGGCCLLMLLGLLLACGAVCGLSFHLVRRAGAQGPDPAPLQVLLLIDQSNSMYEKGGIGSDPNLLRIEAARLFITYLGVDSSGPVHRLGVIFFGDQARLIVPLTSLADDARRAEMVRLIADPPRMGWTDPQAALDLAAETLLAEDGNARRAVILLTDGKPERSTRPTPQEKAATIAQLRETARRFADEEISLFLVLLQNEATDADPEIEALYVPLWQEMAQMTPHGRFYRARRSEELLGIYHDIVVALTGRQTAGVVVQTQVQTETVETVLVEVGLAQVTFVVRKSAPALQVTILRPDGRLLAPGDPDVRYGGRPGQSREEVWAVHAPAPGLWRVRIRGQGTVTVWRDFYPAPPTPTPTPSPPPPPPPPPSPPASPTRPPTPSPLPLLVAPTISPPIPLSPAGPATEEVTGSGGGRSGLWVGLLVVGLALGGGGIWLYRRRRAPLLEGTLRRLAAPVGSAIPDRLDLDALNRREVRLGPDPDADLYLPGTSDVPTPPVRLIAQRGGGGRTGILLTLEPTRKRDGQARINHLPVTDEWPLRDGDLITLGAYRFRYENLRRRSRGGTERGMRQRGTEG